MDWESLPDLFWFFYYIVLLITLGTAIFHLVQKKGKIISMLTIFFTVTTPIVSFMNSIGRDSGVNELEHFMMNLTQGSLWAIYSMTGYLMIMVFWILFSRQIFSADDS
ncbi:hypothetical protein EDD68_1081 [Melghiribacillus thermohalophilus]|uniref:Uncharacterized protein n=1 Tax=Melghiribacillus thermohalophilus TaxID=1324956 RepID=A0A4V6NZZ8_9BACI|nr:hypothetical protein [Melghiribacillus thermohalophilus]TCT22582.1 hypothetical protein EDD68_1081 [Melghiribacillus thermohalophilus]